MSRPDRLSRALLPNDSWGRICRLLEAYNSKSENLVVHPKVIFTNTPLLHAKLKGERRDYSTWMMNFINSTASFGIPNRIGLFICETELRNGLQADSERLELHAWVMVIQDLPEGVRLVQPAEQSTMVDQLAEGKRKRRRLVKLDHRGQPPSGRRVIIWDPNGLAIVSAKEEAAKNDPRWSCDEDGRKLGRQIGMRLLRNQQQKAILEVFNKYKHIKEIWLAGKGNEMEDEDGGRCLEACRQFMHRMAEVIHSRQYFKFDTDAECAYPVRSRKLLDA